MNALVKLEGAVRALAEASTLEEVKHIHDIAQAAAEYARAANLGLDAQNSAAEIKLRAERKAGELLTGLGKSIGGQPTHRGYSSNIGRVDISEYRAVLEGTGTTYQTAHRWQKIADLPNDRFEEYIAVTKAERAELTTSGILRFEKGIVREVMFEQKHTRPFPAGIFQVVYADPPWSYNNSGFDQSAASQYPTMTTDDICTLPVNGITDDDSVLFMWATSPLLPDALRVMSAWRFEYKASMVWVKNRAPGVGWWVQTYHEFLLIGSRVKTPHPLTKPASIITSDVSIHSRKPDCVYEVLEGMYSGPKVELFGRQFRAGWSTWGNENVE